MAAVIFKPVVSHLRGVTHGVTWRQVPSGSLRDPGWGRRGGGRAADRGAPRGAAQSWLPTRAAAWRRTAAVICRRSRRTAEHCGSHIVMEVLRRGAEADVGDPPHEKRHRGRRAPAAPRGGGHFEEIAPAAMAVPVGVAQVKVERRVARHKAAHLEGGRRAGGCGAAGCGAAGMLRTARCDADAPARGRRWRHRGDAAARLMQLRWPSSPPGAAGARRSIP